MNLIEPADCWSLGSPVKPEMMPIGSGDVSMLGTGANLISDLNVKSCILVVPTHRCITHVCGTTTPNRPEAGLGEGF